MPEVKGISTGTLRDNFAITTAPVAVSPGLDGEIATAGDDTGVDGNVIIGAIETEKIAWGAAMSSFTKDNAGKIRSLSHYIKDDVGGGTGEICLKDASTIVNLETRGV